MEQKSKKIKWFSKCPTLLPVIAIIIQELGFWKLIGFGHQSDQILILVVLLTIIVILVGDYEKRIWLVPLIGLLIWDVFRVILIDYRHGLPISLMALFVLLLGSIIVKVKFKIPIPKSAWGISIIFIGLLFLIELDHSDSIRKGLFNLRDIIERWLVISIPLLIYDAALNKQSGWSRYLVYTSMLPFAVLMYPIARLDYKLEIDHQIVSAGFWIFTVFVFFVLIPLIHGMRGEKRNKELTTVCISTVAIVIVSIGKWFFLEEPFDLVSPPWIMVIKYCILLCFPLLLLRFYYKDYCGGI